MPNSNYRIPPEVISRFEAEAGLIVRELSGAKSVVLATPDGFDLASASIDGTDPRKIAAMASSIMAISDAAAKEAGLPGSSSVTVNTDGGFIVLQGSRHGDANVLVNLVGSREAILAQALYRVARLCEKIPTL